MDRIAALLERWQGFGLTFQQTITTAPEASTMAPKYHIDLFWSPEDSCWIANVPDLQYCSAGGETPEEAAREVTIAMELWLEAQEAIGRSLPKAKYVSTVSIPGYLAEDQLHG